MNTHLIGNDKGRIEAHAELSDQLRVFLLVTGQVLEKRCGTGLRNRAEVLDDLIAGHTNTVISNGERPGILIDIHLNGEFSLPLEHAVIRQRGKTQLVDGVGGI